MDNGDLTKKLTTKLMAAVTSQSKPYTSPGELIRRETLLIDMNDAERHTSFRAKDSKDILVFIRERIDIHTIKPEAQKNKTHVNRLLAAVTQTPELVPNILTPEEIAEAKKVAAEYTQHVTQLKLALRNTDTLAAKLTQLLKNKIK